jgi:hypothetical protein
MNEEGSYYLGTTVFDLRSGEQFSIPLASEGEPGNVTNQVLSNVIINNTLLMQDNSSIVMSNDTTIFFSSDTKFKSLTTGDITASNNPPEVYASTAKAGIVQLAGPDVIRGALNKANLANGTSKLSVVSALDLANELNIRFTNSISGGTGVDVTQQSVDLGGDDGTVTQFTINIGQEVNTDSDVEFKTVVATGDITAFSDVRGKENIIDLDASLEKIECLRGVKYNMKSDPSTDRIGVIAQEVESVVPEVVNYDSEKDQYSVSYISLVPLLIEAVKELSEKVKKLEKRV